MLPRRQLLTGAGALLAALALPVGAARAVEASHRRFVFVFAPGGWDPTLVLADAFDHEGVDVQPGCDRATAGGLRFVDHPARPSVRAFFARHHARCLVLEGILVRSIAHEICTMITLTGGASGTTADWPAQIGAGARERYTLPHLVLDGPSFPGPLGTAVARAGNRGELEALLSGRALVNADVPARRLAIPSEGVVDRYLARRAAGALKRARAGVEVDLAGEFAAAHEQLVALEDLRHVVDFTTDGTMEAQVDVAVEALSLGAARCVSLVSTGGAIGWDTHADNDPLQSARWEALFQGLGHLMDALSVRPGTTGATLADETVVVVLSEMGRTPGRNAASGKDHWPYTSALLVGPGITGGRNVGGHDASWYGLPVDPRSGEVSASAPLLSAEVLGATLLALADVDPGDHLRSVAPLHGVLT